MLTLENTRVEMEGFALAADLTLAPRGITAVIGPSGAGKSTLLNLIAGFTPPTRGRLLWDGAEITAAPPAERPVAMIFQDNNLFPHLSAADNAALALTHRRPNANDRARVAAALARVGLAGLEGRKPGQISGGQQSRVALARVLLQRKPLILLDEPFAALGPALRADMLGAVREVAAEIGAGVLMVTHDARDAERADQVITVIDGRATPPRPAAELFADPPPELAAYLGDHG
ncbi:ATP-binding cassette domain-containing protein [Poseidonocella sedimentorum]|uniref:Thiamine transport system ATP-binding protein n=1 Tax=Poseidonocella sedimentorum TaxID=871652 RepID=A0A1I6DYC0_9RHOB|nr:ATP-binding cassette domain-containing protein [Poseidonocella sedimentorum]SFR10332.1 thiamine transport system ATP-binding protein [Poseidonocella sedimentorum]